MNDGTHFGFLTRSLFLHVHSFHIATIYFYFQFVNFYLVKEYFQQKSQMCIRFHFVMPILERWTKFNIGFIV